MAEEYLLHPENLMKSGTYSKEEGKWECEKCDKCIVWFG